MLGFHYRLGTINAGDSAEMYATLRTNEGIVPVEEIASVEYTIQLPNGALEGPFSGSVEEDGRGYYRWTQTEEAGEYVAQAQFTLTNGEKKSVMVSFAVYDPFDQTPKTAQEIIADEVWLRLEDAFDSIDGGPWLRDETNSYFDSNKISRFIPEALMEINVQMPPTQYTIKEFVNETKGELTAQGTILVKGVLLRTIQHLIRSYVEQPIPRGPQVVYEDRTRYAQVWQTVYQAERENWLEMVRLMKRQELQFGHSALLISSKQGRIFYGGFGGILRTQGVGRGWY